ncbi:hypothetical protein OU995_05190 [Roseateles sp. SL47]|uniref:oxidoreductase-like domain-containing protein n=1 Tax=Roseateles sp. SL47 TaxID=2995138 RepID=UPI002270A291|nr:oxidoreductase-like domain-containing protein [Roseateles sp. SL47]WAC74126.1 hypothetical protein OU995_05190 [Roseateles sp. SL47]
MIAPESPSPLPDGRPVDADPMPVPPPQPDFDACCGNGCDPCIFDLHDLEMDRYRQALRAWRERHPDLEPSGFSPMSP